MTAIHTLYVQFFFLNCRYLIYLPFIWYQTVPFCSTLSPNIFFGFTLLLFLYSPLLNGRWPLQFKKKMDSELIVFKKASPIHRFQRNNVNIYSIIFKTNVVFLFYFQIWTTWIISNMEYCTCYVQHNGCLANGSRTLSRTTSLWVVSFCVCA